MIEVEVPGKGVVEFPDGMNPRDMEHAIFQAFPDLVNTPQKQRKAELLAARSEALYGPTMGEYQKAVGEGLEESLMKPFVPIPRPRKLASPTGPQDTVSQTALRSVDVAFEKLIGAAEAIETPLTVAMVASGAVVPRTMAAAAGLMGAGQVAAGASEVVEGVKKGDVPAVVGGTVDTALGGLMLGGSKGILDSAKTALDTKVAPVAPASAEAAKATVDLVKPAVTVDLSKPAEALDLTKPVITVDLVKPVEMAKVVEPVGYDAGMAALQTVEQLTQKKLEGKLTPEESKAFDAAWETMLKRKAELKAAREQPPEPVKTAPLTEAEKADIQADLVAELGDVAMEPGKTSKGLTQEAFDFIQAQEVPKTVTRNLRRIAEENGIEVSNKTTPDEIVSALKAKGRQELFETITPANDTLIGRNTAGEDLYQRTDGSVYRMRLDKTKTRPNGYPDFGGDLAPVETKPAVEPVAPPPEPIGMGGATPSEFAPPEKFTTAIKNAVTDKERADMGFPPVDPVIKRDFGTVRDDALRIMDEQGPAATDTLIADLKQRPRALTDTEDALLLYRQVDLKNEFNKAKRDLKQAVDDARTEDALVQEARVADLRFKLLELLDIEKKVGTENARGLGARRMLSNEDYTLASMETERQSVKGNKPLTKQEVAEVEQAHKEIKGALDEVEAANATVGTVKPGQRPAKPVVDAEFKLDKAKRKWHERLRQDAENNLPVPVRIVQRIGEAWNDTRTLLTAFDFGALLRQGFIPLVSRPITTAKAIPTMFKAVRERGAFEIERQILSRPNAKSGLYERSGLYLAEHGKALSKMEEAYMARLAEKIPGVGASQRAYTTYLNHLRADLFDTFVETLGRKGQVTLPEAKVIANFVNAATGRGDLGKFNAAAVPMATVFFAPRFVASRFQMLLGQPIYHGVLSGKVGFKEATRARKLVAGEYARLAVGIGLMYSLFKLAGLEVGDEKTSSDYGKVILGNTRVDPLAGLQQALVFLAREISGETTNFKGQTKPIRGPGVKRGDDTGFSVLTKFLRTKLSPIPGAIVNALAGKDVIGDDVTLGGEAEKLLVPITWQDVLSTMEEQGIPRGTALQLLSIFGAGVSTYD